MGFEATRYALATDQLGTQLDPPAHWAPEYAAIDELPATFAVRPLVVISVVREVRKNFNYALKVSDIRAWEARHGAIPPGSVVFVRSDWSKRWPDPKLATLKQFPGVTLDALKSCTCSAISSSTATSRWTRTPRRRSKARRGSCITATRRQRAWPTSTGCPPPAAC